MGQRAFKNTKVTASDFTPRTLRLGNKSKKVLVLVTATENPYPGPLQRLTTVGEVIKRVATDSAAEAGLLETYERIVKIPQVFENLVIWVCYSYMCFSILNIFVDCLLSRCFHECPHASRP